MTLVATRRNRAVNRVIGLIVGISIAVVARMVTVQLGSELYADSANAFVRGAVETDRAYPRLVTSDGVVVARSIRIGERWIRQYPVPGLTALLGVLPAEGYPEGLEAVVAHDQDDDRSPIELTLDARVQEAAAGALGAKDGSVLVLEVDGSILAAVDATKPLADPAVLARRPGIGDGRGLWAPGSSPVLFSRPAPAGSTLKPLVFARAVEAGTVDEDEVFPARSSFASPGGRRIQNYAGFTCPAGGLVESIARSCNTTAVDVASRMGAVRLRSTFRAAGFGRALQAPFATSVPALDRGWPQDVDQVSLAAIGQGEARLTLLGLGLAYAGLGSGGATPTPRIFASDPTSASGGPVATGTGREVALSGMQATAAYGTGHKLAGVDVAVKTGTATRDQLHRSDGWVVALVPARQPRFVVVVRIDGRTTSAGGGDAVDVLHAFLTTGALEGR